MLPATLSFHWKSVILIKIKGERTKYTTWRYPISLQAENCFKYIIRRGAGWGERRNMNISTRYHDTITLSLLSKICKYNLTNSSEAGIRSAVLEISCVLRNPKFYCLLTRTPPLDPVLSQVNRVAAAAANFCLICFSATVPSMSRSCKLFVCFFFIFYDQHFYAPRIDP